MEECGLRQPWTARLSVRPLSADGASLFIPSPFRHRHIRQKHMAASRGKHGFTLVELLLVIAIIGTLIGLLLV
jgi:prepilin-type N-terminal cleavage/methylation domain-containing protein